jgi:CheY-like chemotaxis protein/signal transduction histidine kinase
VVGTAVADWFTPLGVAVWIVYIAPLVLCTRLRAQSAPMVVALLAVVGIGICAVTDAAGMAARVALINRAMGVGVVLIVAAMVSHMIRRQLADLRSEWLQRNRASLVESVQGELEPAQAGDRVLRAVAELTGAQIGGFYLVKAREARLRAWLALDRSAAPSSFAAGEGLIGQALTDPRIVELGDLPEESFRVDAGVAMARPRHLIIAPLWADKTAVAVVALGATQPFAELGRALLEHVSEPLAVAIRTTVYRSELRELLAETQRQAGTLQAQQDELRVANEELESQGQALRESAARLEEQQAELEHANSHLEGQTAELEQQRDELVAAKELAVIASQHKSQFLANMSHELRTPLNSALMLAHLLAENRDGNLTEEQIKHAQTIYSAGNDLLALINDILDLSRIEAGRVDVELETVSPAGIATQLETVFRPVAEQRGLRLSVEVASDVRESIQSDGRLVQQILRNLLSNALKFTHIGEVALTVGRARDGVRFAVRDTGIGVPADKLELIFEPFHQADGTTVRKYGGTGLGLTISRELARVLGGTLRVESAPGRGSTFTLILPPVAPSRPPERARVQTSAAAPEPMRVRAATAQDAAAPTPEPPRFGDAIVPDDRDNLTRPGRLILVVEDDAAFAGILLKVAHEREFDCVVAGTAEEGLHMARSLVPSGILLDIRLPDGSGMSVLERLKKDPHTRHVPVHVISAVDHVHTAMALGAIGYAVKPIERDQLLEAMGRIEDRLTARVRRVLVVEDDPRQRDSACALLAGDGIELVPVGTMSDALASLSRQSFDCMVLDLQLPDGSGFDLLDRMAASEEYGFPPVIVYTGRALDSDEEARLRRYSRSIIVKGARSPERLLDEVTLFLHQVEAAMPPDRQKMLQLARSRDAAFEGRRILVVEDDVRNLFALSSVLEPRGARVEIARSGREALQRLEQGPPPDLVLMDVMMPEMDGLTATREIRKRPDLRDLPIIAITAKAMRDDQERCLSAGASDYMPKPLDVDKLLSLCRVWMTRAP